MLKAAFDYETRGARGPGAASERGRIALLMVEVAELPAAARDRYSLDARPGTPIQLGLDRRRFATSRYIPGTCMSRAACGTLVSMASCPSAAAYPLETTCNNQLMSRAMEVRIY